MHIVHIAKIKGIAGSEGHLLRLLPGLRDAGIEVEMLVLDSTGQQSAEFVEALQKLNIKTRILRISAPIDLTLIPRLAQYLRITRPDIVHTHMVHADVYGIPASRLARVQAVVTSRHNQDWFRTRLPFTIVNPLLWMMVDRGIAISQGVQEFIEKTEAGATGKLAMVHYGLEISREAISNSSRRKQLRAEWGIHDDAPVIGSLCRLIEQKGLSYAIHAFVAVSSKVPDAHYVIAGEGNLRDSLERLANDLGVTDRVHFAGWRRDIHAVLDTFDVFLAPSLWEGFGLVLLEAMSHELPIVATRAGGIPEIVVDGETGYLVESGKSEPLVEPLVRLLTDKSTHFKMGQAGRQRLETQFSIQKMLDSTMSVYQDAVKSK